MRSVTHRLVLRRTDGSTRGTSRGARAVVSRPYVTAGGTGSALSVPAAAPAQCALHLTDICRKREISHRGRAASTSTRTGERVDWGGRVVPLDNRPVPSRRRRTVVCVKTAGMSNRRSDNAGNYRPDRFRQ